MTTPKGEDALILNVNDDEPNRYAVSRMLTRAGYRVIDAATGSEALARLADEPDLVVLDVNLPDLNGFEVCRRIKGDPATSSVQVLHLTANFVRAQDQVYGLETGADSYLIQPVEPAVLLATVRSLLRVRRIESALRRSRDELRVILEGVGEAITAQDPAGRLIFANRAAARASGYDSPEELVAVPAETIDASQELFDERGASLARTDLPAAEVLRGAPSAQKVVRFRAPDGSERWSAVSSAAIRDERGAVAMVINIAHDITDLRRLHAEAERAVKVRDDFLSMVSHDLRNPLQSVRVAAALLKRKASEGSDGHRQAQIIENSVERMTRLVRDLLDVAAIEAGRLSVEKRPEEGASIVEEVVQQLQPLSLQRGVLLKGRTAPGSVECDRDRLLQVLGNLIGNALRHTPSGRRVTVSVARCAEGLEFTVEDEGTGIPPELLPSVFDPWVRARRGGREGAGLGLSIARGIVEAHGGRIWIESQLGVGTVVRFAVPERPPATEAK